MASRVSFMNQYLYIVAIVYYLCGASLIGSHSLTSIATGNGERYEVSQPPLAHALLAEYLRPFLLLKYPYPSTPETFFTLFFSAPFRYF